MQGHDFSALRASGDAMAKRKISRVMTEVWYDDISTYRGVQNDLCRDWLPFMTSIGYELVRVDVDPFNTEDSTRNAQLVKKRCKEKLTLNPDRPSFKAGLKETDVYWRLKSDKSTEHDSMDMYEYNSHHKFLFTPEEYASCSQPSSGEA
jgi:hypothetical protein